MKPTAIEYGLIAALIAVVIITAVTSMSEPKRPREKVAHCPAGSTYIPRDRLCYAGVTVPEWR